MMRDIQGRFRFLLALCAMSCLSYGGHVAAKKSSDVYTVRYSYEKQTRAGTKRYVLVPQIIEIASKKYQDFKTRHRVLFDAMKREKRKSYGGTKFNTKNDVVQPLAVVCWLVPPGSQQFFKH